MNIPTNGRIAIVDDIYEEVRPLINIFSKKRIPYNYYSGVKSGLPENTDGNPVTLIFLDLNLVESQHSSTSVISTLNPILDSLCPKNFKPYFLVIWSKKINEFADALDRHFNTSSDLKKRKPLKTIRLNKSDYFNLDANGTFLFDENKYQDLITNLKSSVENISILNNFFAWENLVHHEAMETTNEFASFFDIDSDWDVNTKAIIFHLAKAVIGNDSIQTASDDQKMLSAFDVISSFLGDRIKVSMKKNMLGQAKNIVDDKLTGKNKGRLTNNLQGKINSKLHLAEGPIELNSFEQGNIYKLKNEYNLVKRILDKEVFGKVKIADIIATRPSLIQLDITPVCDYSQDKKYTRLIYGLLIDFSFYEKAKNAYYFQTPILLINDKEKYFLFDFRFISTMTKVEIMRRKRSPAFRLRKEICTDIQSQLANQMSRPGYSNV